MYDTFQSYRSARLILAYQITQILIPPAEPPEHSEVTADTQTDTDFMDRLKEWESMRNKNELAQFCPPWLPIAPMLGIEIPA
jgi:hypothetical protein